MRQEPAEVLVIGGGAAGCALSIRLARIGCPVVLVERTTYQDFRPGESLPPSVVPRLQELGIWQSFLATEPEPAFGIHSAWGTRDLDSTSFLTHPSLNGWRVNRSRFDAMLSSAAEAAGARVYRSTTIELIERGPQQMWSASATSPLGKHHFAARFIVDATGRAGRVCARLGISRRTADHLVGIASISLDKSLSAPLPALVESHPLGWWYSAGLPGDGAIAIFFTDSDLCSKYCLARADVWRRTLADSIHTRTLFASASPTQALRVFPAASHCLDRACGDSWLAIGDTAIGRDPLSSSGIDFALASAERGAAVLAALGRGNRTPADNYSLAIHADFTAYLGQRHAYYSMEGRWAESPFWQRRHQDANSLVLN